MTYEDSEEKSVNDLNLCPITKVFLLFEAKFLTTTIVPSIKEQQLSSSSIFNV